MNSAILEYPAGAKLPNGIQVQGVALGTGTRYSERRSVFVSGTATIIKPGTEDGDSVLSRLVAAHRAFFLSLPIGLGVLFTLLAYFGGPEVQKVLQFMAPWSVPFQR